MKHKISKILIYAGILLIVFCLGAAVTYFLMQTVWPSKMPRGCDPAKILENAKNPGLGVRELHKQGITGKGVNVAIIDQPLYQDHPEFAGKIKMYRDFDCKSESSMNGPAVASLLVGNSTGTAPGANLYYAAAPSWLTDAGYYAMALDWIVEETRAIPKTRRRINRAIQAVVELQGWRIISLCIRRPGRPPRNMKKATSATSIRGGKD